MNKIRKSNLNKIRKSKNIGLFCKWLGIYFFFLPLGAMNIGSLGSLLKILALVPVFIWLTKKHTIKINYVIINTLFFVLICTLSIVWSINFDESVSRAVSHITFFILLVAVSGYSYDDGEIYYLKKCLIWSSRITALLTLAFGSYLQGRLYLNGIISEDPNYLCAYFLFGAVMDIIILLTAQISKKKKFFSVIELMVYLFIILATGSRGGVTAFATATIISLFLYSDSNGAITLTLLKKLLICLFIFIGLYLVMKLLPQDIVLRFSSDAIKESNGTGRYELWEDAFFTFKHSSFFRQIAGYGTGTVIDITYLFPFHRHNVMHNIFVENLIEIGCVGLFTYVINIVSYIYSSIKNKDLYSLAVISGMVVMSLSTSLYTFKPYWNIMLFILCVTYARKDTLERKSNENLSFI